jgi:hypothetical protein
MFLLLWACTGGGQESGAEESKGGTDSVGDSQADPCVRVEGATGTLALSFAMEPDYIPSMEEPPTGNYRGSIYSCEQGSAVGPVEGAEPLMDLVVPVDLVPTNGELTGVLHVTDPIPAEWVWVMGCLDTDGNDCDRKDPITRPSDNRVVVIPDAETPFTVYFGMLNPS